MSPTKSLRFRTTIGARRPRRHRRLPELEGLEERVVLSPTTYTVDLTTDNGPTSAGSGSGTTGDLRYVIGQADADPNPDGSLIQFDPTVFATPQTITLSPSLGTLDLTNTAGPEVIDGTTAGVTVSGGNTVEVFRVSNDVTASISGLTITGGRGGVSAIGPGTLIVGGGIDNDGTLTVSNSTISGNSASDFGGGINNLGTLTVSNSTISGNSGGYGGGINTGGTLTVKNSTISDNSALSGGGGIGDGEILTYTNPTTNPTVTVEDSTISGNSAVYSVGGIESFGGSPDSTLTVTSCTISGNSGINGGIGGSAPAATVTNCTISGNSGVYAGGVSFGGTLVTIAYCTISGNSGEVGGIAFSGGQLTMTDSLIGGNSGSSLSLGSSGAVLLSHNLFSDSPGVVLDSTNLINTDPLLGPLTDNGGPTQTMALLPGSPAIGAGTAVAGVTTDQRGVARPTVAPDIGAYQSAFSELTDHTITYGTPSVTFTGTFAYGSQVPAGETVAITLDGITQQAPVGPDGSFATTFAAAALPASATAYTVTYTFAAQGPFAAASGSSRLTVDPALLTITANSLTIPYGGAVPTLTASYTGFVDGQTPADLTTPVVLSTSATGDSPAGAYAILASDAGSSNYTIRYIPGTLTIAPPPTPATPQARAAQGFVTALYRDVLGRGAEPSGLRYWNRQFLGHVPSRAIWGLFGRSKERRGLEREGKAPTIPLRAAYQDALRASQRAARQPKVVPAGPVALLTSRHARASTEGDVPRAEAPPMGAGRA